MSGVDLTELPLSPFEGFVLSRIDGEANVALLADLVNLEEQEVLEILERFIELGAVEWARETVSLPRATGRVSTGTPARPARRDEVLRSSGGGRVRRGGGRIRITKPKSSSSSSAGEYKSHPPGEEKIDTSRRSVLRPRASHTGSIRPPGFIEEDADADAQSLEDLAAALGAVTDALAEPEAPGAASEDEPSAEAEPEEPADEDEPVEATQAAAAVSGGSEPIDVSAATERPPEMEAAAEASEEPQAGGSEEAEAEAPEEAEAEAGGSEEAEAEASEEAEPADAEPGGAEAGGAEQAVEEIDLDLERRRRINDLYFALDLLDHYQVLGVERTAVRKEIRHSYFTLSKVFHPDTMFGKRLGSYKQKMEAIFQRITEAYEVLGKKKPRAEYDGYLELQDRTRAVEAAIEAPDHETEERTKLGLAAALDEADVAAGRRPSRAPGPPVPEAAPEPEVAPEPEAEPVPVRREMSEAAKARARKLMAKKLRNATRASGRERRAKKASVPPPSTEKIGREQVLRSLAASLKDSAGHTGGLDRIRRHELSAERAEREGDLAGAASHYRLALSLAPDREDLREAHERVNQLLSAELAATYEQQAEYEQRHGKWSAAAISWAKVADGRPNDSRPARLAAECLVEAKGDLHKARELARRAAELAPDDVACLRVLGQVYVAAGLALNARRVLQRAATLDPNDEMVENLLRDLGA